jgi:hypothetical protein
MAEKQKKMQSFLHDEKLSMIEGGFQNVRIRKN